MDAIEAVRQMQECANTMTLKKNTEKRKKRLSKFEAWIAAG